MARDINLTLREYECPVCGRNFIPAPMHAWTAVDEKYKKVFVCSYSCMRKTEKSSKWLKPKKTARRKEW